MQHTGPINKCTVVFSGELLLSLKANFLHGDWNIFTISSLQATAINCLMDMPCDFLDSEIKYS